MRPDTIRSWTRLSLLAAAHTGTPVGLNRLFARLTLTTSIGIMELKFLKHVYPRLNSTTADRYKNGPLREERVVEITGTEILQSLTPKARIETCQSPPTTVLLILIHKQSTPSRDEDQAPVVQRADTLIHWISHYTAGQMYSNQCFWQVFHTIPYLNLIYAFTLSTSYRAIRKILHTFYLPGSDLSSG